MPSCLSLYPRRNGRRLAHDGSSDFDIATLGVWIDDNLTPDEMRRVISMIQDTLDKGKPLAGDSRGGLPRPTAAAVKGFASRYPGAAAIRREG